jgi:hypothetical protein
MWYSRGPIWNWFPRLNFQSLPALLRRGSPELIESRGMSRATLPLGSSNRNPIFQFCDLGLFQQRYVKRHRDAVEYGQTRTVNRPSSRWIGDLASHYFFPFVESVRCYQAAPFRERSPTTTPSTSSSTRPLCRIIQPWTEVF